MSSVKDERGRLLFYDSEGKPHLLLDAGRYSANRSEMLQATLNAQLGKATKKIFKRTHETMAQLVTYLRIVARLLRKPQVHSVLHVGQWSPLDETLAEILPQFNPANKLYCLSNMRPLEEFPAVTFLCASGGEFPLPENRFDTIIFNAVPKTLDLLFALKDFGKLYFVARSLNESFRPHAQAFTLTKNATLFELTVSPQLRRQLYARTPQGQVSEKLSAITRLVAKTPAVVKKFGSLPAKRRAAYLDEYIAEITRAEKVLAEIFPALHSDSVKLNFNMLKEFLIDLRLGIGSADRVDRQYEILAQDLSNA